MAKLKAFRAIRPTRDKAHLVVTRPVSTYKKNVLKAKLESNPYTFIRIIHPEFDKEHAETKPNSIDRFQLVREKYSDFMEEEILFQDHTPHIYLYKQTTPTHEFLGIIAGASVDEYNSDKIKKHEATLTTREEMFTNYLEVVGYNAEPVLLSYPHNPAIENIYALIMANRPEYEFSTTDKTKHELWILSKVEQHTIEQAFDAIEASYIADGHHRSASSASLAQRINSKASSQNDSHNYFLAFFMDEKRINILEFNRLIHHTNDLSTEELLNRISIHFNIIPSSIPCKPQREHEITMNIDGNWFLLQCKEEIIEKGHPVACLDAEILTQFILTPILGIKDLKTDPTIEFIPGNLGLNAIIQPIQQNKAKIGFVLFPVTMDQVKRVADHQMIMPPKSTWVEPKLRSGLTIYEIES